MPDGASRDPQIVCRDNSTRRQTRFYLSVFPAKFQIVWNNDKILQMPLQCGNPTRTPLSPDGPNVQLTNGNKRERNGFSFDERPIEFASAVSRLAQERENVGIKKDGVHSDFPLAPALVSFLNELIDILSFWPRARHLLGILHGPNPLYFCQFLQSGRREKLSRKSPSPICRIWLGSAFYLPHLLCTLASRYFRHRSVSRSRSVIPMLAL
jgi:hypothetical protein